MNKLIFLIISFLLFSVITTGCVSNNDTVTNIADSAASQTRETGQMNDNSASTDDILSKYDCVRVSNGIQIAQLVEVIDGDTIDVRMDGSTYRVRYIGINAPEYDEGLGQEATDFNAHLVKGQELYLVKDVSETDDYGRLLRYIFTEKEFINYEIVFGGYARQRDYDPDTACSQTFAEAEESAKSDNVGIWATPAADGEEQAVQIISLNYKGQAGENEPDEYVEIKNTGSQTVDVNGWYIKDLGKHRYVFPSMDMAAGEACRIFTNQDHPETCGLSFNNEESGIWNNSGDCATLYDAEGLQIDEFCYP